MALSGALAIQLQSEPRFEARLPVKGLSNISVFVASVYLYDDITASLRIWDTSLTVNVCQLTIFLC